MDYRNLPVARGPWAAEPEAGLSRSGTFIGGVALYLLAAAVIGLPLLFPGQQLFFSLVDLVLAGGVAFLLSHLLRRSGRNSTASRTEGPARCSYGRSHYPLPPDM
jgi:hypothetical protein